jgi:hypothetical protein
MAKYNTYNHLEFNNTEGGLFLTYTNKNGAKVAAGLRRIFPSYGTETAQSIELVEAGPLEGSIIAQTPKSFVISCGETPPGATSTQDGVAGVWNAANGDIVLSAPNGSVRIVAKNIELISHGDPSESTDRGHVSMYATGDVRSVSDNIKMKANTDVAVSAESNLLLVSTNQMTLGGEVKIDEGSDPATLLSSLGTGSKTPFQWVEMIEKFVNGLKSAAS